MKTIRIAVAASLVFTAGQAGAQSREGALDSTSSSTTSVVTIIKENAVKISDVDDITFGDTNVNGGVVAALTAANNSQFDDVCVFSSTGQYQVSVASANGNFSLRDASTAAGAGTVSYSVDWDVIAASVPTGTSETIASGDAAVAVTTDFPGNATETDCGATGNNARFTVTLDEADYNAADPATYTDTLTLTVIPT